MDKEQVERAYQQATDENAVPNKPNTSSDTSKPDNAKAMIKLVALVALCFVVVKYGVPLYNQISERSNEVLDSNKKEESKPDPEIQPIEQPATPQSTVRITKGYEAWEPAVREQIESWLGEKAKYKLTNIDVNDARDTMEIRLRLIDNDGFTSKEKVVLKKDGFGDRFIYTHGDNEFLVYPPE